MEADEAKLTKTIRMKKRSLLLKLDPEESRFFNQSE